MSIRQKVFLGILLIVLGVLGRLLPHPWNFTPLLAIGLYGSRYVGVGFSLTVVAITMLVSDALIRFYSVPVMISVYATLFLSASFGWYARRGLRPIVAASVAGSTLFFLTTNWAVWQFGSMYSHTFLGLVDSFLAGLPFYRNALVGDLFYTTTLVLLHEYGIAWVKRYGMSWQFVRLLFYRYFVKQIYVK